MKTNESNAIAAPLQADRGSFKANLASFVDVVESLPILRPRLVLLDLAILALFLIH
jgi:hypothetical protein